MEFSSLQLEFWRTLFDPDDQICVAKYLQGTSLRPVPTSGETGYPWAQFFGLNSLQPGSSRSDTNVCKHRSFLIEFDDLDRAEQLATIERLQLPWSTCVFSGNKSLHFVIALTKPVSAEEYRSLALRLLAACPGADRACKNPSRLSRYPEVQRLGSVLNQDLLEVRGRIDRAALEQWLGRHSPTTNHHPPGLVSVGLPLPLPLPLHDKRRLRNRTLGFLHSGAEAQRNTETFSAACDLAACGYSRDEAVAKLLPVLPLLNAQKPEPFTVGELLSAVDNAFRHMARQVDQAS